MLALGLLCLHVLDLPCVQAICYRDTIRSTPKKFSVLPVALLQRMARGPRPNETVFSESFSTQLDFGLGPKVRKAIQVDVAALRKQAAMRSLVAMPKKAPKLPRHGFVFSDATLGSRDGREDQWAARLEAIAQRAGGFATINHATNEEDNLTEIERRRLPELVFTSGALRAMESHIRRGEKLEVWAEASEVQLFPVTADVLLKYALALDIQSLHEIA